jgi:hypothetical protein
VFVNKRLFFGYVEDFNDPFEFSINLADSHYFARQPVIYHSFKHGFTVFCASEEETKNDALLWSHYAQNHQGICIEFTPHYDDDNSPFGDLEPVKYRDTVAIPPSDSHEAIHGYLKTVVKTKAACWEYEKEWRVVKLNNVGEEVTRVLRSGLTVDCGRFHNFSPLELTKVILGCKCSKENERVVLNWVRQLGNSDIVVEKCVQDEKDYRLKFV